jgi:hypothetical protein
MYLWRRKDSTTTRTERTQWAQTMDVSRTRGANGRRVEDEGAWYEAEVEAQLLEDEGLRGRRNPSSPQKFIACINGQLRPTIFCISVCIPSNVVWSIVVPTCWANRYISRAVSYWSRSDGLLVRMNVSKCDLI